MQNTIIIGQVYFFYTKKTEQVAGRKKFSNCCAFTVQEIHDDFIVARPGTVSQVNSIRRVFHKDKWNALTFNTRRKISLR